MTPERLAELRKMAEEYGSFMTSDMVCIQAFNKAVIMELLDEIERLQKETNDHE